MKAVCNKHEVAYDVDQGCLDCRATEEERPKRVLTGIPELDKALAESKGLPPGKITELYGYEYAETGKLLKFTPSLVLRLRRDAVLGNLSVVQATKKL